MKKTIIIVLLAAFIASCSSVLLTGRRQVMLVSDADMLTLSLQSYKEFIDSVPASKDAVNTNLVKKVGANIAKAVETYLKANGMEAEIASYAWEFALVQESQVNAFCMPGGKVVFYEGILPITQSEAGIAVVMGHEVAHAVAKHSAERMSQQLISSYGSTIADVLLANKSTVVRTGIGALYGLGTQYGILLPYSRLQESEADHLGLIFMAMAGYNPNEAVSFWQRMAATKSGTVPEFLSTHPSDDKRIAKIRELIPEAMKYYQVKEVKF